MIFTKDDETITTPNGGVDFTASMGKNLLINGDFSVWQRGVTFNGGYTADRWRFTGAVGDGNGLHAINKIGDQYNSLPNSNNMIQVINSNTNTGYTFIEQRIEDVSRFFGKTITLSFYAKVPIGEDRNDFESYLSMNFGTGGSASINIDQTQRSITSTLTKYEYTFNIPAYSGETVNDTDSSLRLVFRIGTSVQTVEFTIAETQLEFGKVATQFEMVDPALNLMRCQRYYEVLEIITNSVLTVSQANSTTTSIGDIKYTNKRINAVSITASGTGNLLMLNSNGASAGGAFDFSSRGNSSARVNGTGGTGLIAGDATTIFNSSASSEYIYIDAEL